MSQVTSTRYGGYSWLRVSNYEGFHSLGYVKANARLLATTGSVSD